MLFNLYVRVDSAEHFWHLSSGTLIRTLTGHSHWVTSVAISADGNILVTGSKDKTIKLWQLGSEQIISTLTGHLESICAVAVSPQA